MSPSMSSVAAPGLENALRRGILKLHESKLPGYGITHGDIASEIPEFLFNAQKIRCDEIIVRVSEICRELWMLLEERQQPLAFFKRVSWPQKLLECLKIGVEGAKIANMMRNHVFTRLSWQRAGIAGRFG